MNIRFSLALLLLVIISQLLQEVEGDRRKLCGSNLSAALDLICVNGFSHTIGNRRRRSPEQDLQRKWNQLAVEKQLDQLVANEDKGAIEASEYSERELRRPRRRIAHECCAEGCTYDDIARYCA